MREKEEEEGERGRGPEVWRSRGGDRGEEIDIGGDVDAGGDVGAEDKGKRKRSGSGGGGARKKAARGKQTPATAATATLSSKGFTSSYRGVTCLPGVTRRWEARFTRDGCTWVSSTPIRVQRARSTAWRCGATYTGSRKKGSGGRGGAHNSSPFERDLNFEYTEYKGELEELSRMTQEQLVLRLRRAGGDTRDPTSSKFQGVCWVRDRRRWQAHFKHNGKTVKLGNFVTEDGAARGYDHMMLWFKLRGVERRGGCQLNFDCAEYESELEELGRMTQIEVVAKLRLQAQAQLGAHREAETSGEGDEAGEGAGWDAGGIELSGAGHDEGDGKGEGEGDGLPLDGAPAPHPNFLRWWRLGPLGCP
jgi:hypothetical protein